MRRLRRLLANVRRGTALRADALTLSAAAFVMGIAVVLILVIVLPRHPSSLRTSSSSSHGVSANLPELSSELISGVNATDVTVAPVTSGSAGVMTSESVAVSESLNEVPSGSSAVAAELVTLTNMQYPAGELVWAVQVVPKFGYGPPSGGPPGYTGPPPLRNFRVDFVDAKTGQWLEAVEGYSSPLG